MNLTGKLFLSAQSSRQLFQLEAIIDDNYTRLQAEGSLPAECREKKEGHSGLKIDRVQETFPPTYIINCSCGYEIEMEDVNYAFFQYKK